MPQSTKTELVGALADTNRNLKMVDRMLGEYKDLGAQQGKAIDRLRDDLTKTTDRLREERMRRTSVRESERSLHSSNTPDRSKGKMRRFPTSPHRDYERSFSDHESGAAYSPGQRRRRRTRSGVRFRDDMDADEDEVHDLHQSIRDLTNDQIRLEDDLNREIERRNRTEHDNIRSLSELSSNMRQSGSSEATHAVDHKLQTIQDELRAERQLLRRRHEEVGKISSELKQALQQATNPRPAPTPTVVVNAPDGGELQTKLTLVDSQRKQVESELDQIRRKLDQSEGGKRALIEQIEDMRLELKRADSDRLVLRSQMQQQQEEIRERSKRRTDDDDWNQEKWKLENELKELRAQISKSGLAGELSDLRRELDRSERQRAQLSDHIEVLTKDSESKEKQMAKCITQLQESNEKFELSERQRQQAQLQLEETLKKLQEMTRNAEVYANELRETKHALSDTQNKRSETKTMAQEAIKQWKLKTRKLERDLDRQKHTNQKVMERTEQLIKENEASRSQATTGSHQLEMMRREVNDLLAIRAQQDEQLRIREMEVNELKALQLEMDNQLRENRVVMEKMEQDLQSSQGKSSTYFEEKSKLEDELSALQSAQSVLKEQQKQMQNELRELGLQKSNLAARLADAAAERQDLKISLAESTRGESSAREELEKLMHRFKEEKDSHTKLLKEVRKELNEVKGRESHTIQDLTRKFKKEIAEHEAEIQTLKLEIQEERSSAKLIRRQDDKLKTEIERLHQEVVRLEDENSNLTKKNTELLQNYEAKTLIVEEDLSRMKEVEGDLISTKDTLRNVNREYESVFLSVSAELDSFVEILDFSDRNSYKALSCTIIPGNPHSWLAEIKSKFQWLRSEFREQQNKERRLKRDVREVVTSSERDREYLMHEIERRNNVLEALAHERNEIALKDEEKTAAVVELQQEIAELENSLVVEKEDALQRDIEMQQERQNLLDDFNILKDTQEERNKIHERYARLQLMLTNLKDELAVHKARNRETKKVNEDRSLSPTRAAKVSNLSNDSYSARTPPRSKRLTNGNITPQQETPTSLGRRSQSVEKTPPPLTLTDDEFSARFIPKSPKISFKSNPDVFS